MLYARSYTVSAFPIFWQSHDKFKLLQQWVCFDKERITEALSIALAEGMVKRNHANEVSGGARRCRLVHILACLVSAYVGWVALLSQFLGSVEQGELTNERTSDMSLLISSTSTLQQLPNARLRAAQAHDSIATIAALRGRPDATVTGEYIPPPSSPTTIETATTTPPLPPNTSSEPLAVVNGIPRMIHQSWKSVDRIPARFEPWMRTWMEKHPHWEYVFWTDADNLALFEHLYPRYLYIARVVSKIALADMARYALLHRLGGLYADADFECTQPFDALHREYELFLSSEPLAHAVLLEKSTSPAICNALMASVPQHPFWLRVLESIKLKFDKVRLRADAVTLTGPRIVKYTRDEFFAGDPTVTVLPPEFFYPEVAYWNVGAMKQACQLRADAAAEAACAWLARFPRGEFTAQTHATHHWQCTWCLQQRATAFTTLAEVMAGFALNSSIRVRRPLFTSSKVELVAYPS